MSYTQVQVDNILATIADKFKIPNDLLKEVLDNTDYKKTSIFASKKAMLYANSNNVDIKKVKTSGKNGKIKIDDLKLFTGEISNLKVENIFASSAAKKLAEEKGFKQSDFKNTEKSGRKRKSGAVTITIQDVRIKAGEKIKKPTRFASPDAKKLAKKVGFKAKGIKGDSKRGKITISQIRKATKSQ